MSYRCLWDSKLIFCYKFINVNNNRTHLFTMHAARYWHNFVFRVLGPLKVWTYTFNTIFPVQIVAMRFIWLPVDQDGNFIHVAAIIIFAHRKLPQLYKIKYFQHHPMFVLLGVWSLDISNSPNLQLLVMHTKCWNKLKEEAKLKSRVELYWLERPMGSVCKRLEEI